MEAGYAIVGLCVGFLVGLTGVGGGSLMAPLLILLFGFSPAVAIGTDLWFAAITKSVGGGVHRQFGTPDWQVIRRLALGSIPAALATLVWLGAFHQGRLESSVLLALLGAALLLTALILPAKGHLTRPFERIKDELGARMRTHQLAATVIAGAMVGCLVTLTSVGAGALVAVILMLLYPFRLDTKSLVGTDIIHAIPLAFVAALGHSWFGNVNWLLLGNLLLGSIPGIVAGSLAASRVNETLVRLTLAVMLALAGIKLLTM